MKPLKRRRSPRVCRRRDQFREKRRVKRARHWQQEFITAAHAIFSWPVFFQTVRRLKNRRQVHAHFFAAAARHQRDPRLRGIELVLGPLNFARDCWPRQLRQRVANKSNLHSPPATKKSISTACVVAGLCPAWTGRSPVPTRAGIATLRRSASISCAPYMSPEASPAEMRTCTGTHCNGGGRSGV